MTSVSRFRTVAFVAAFFAVILTTPSPVSAQFTPADSAAVLLDAAERFEAAGRPDVARAIYQMVTMRFAGTSAAARSAERLTALAPDDPERSGQVELLVWSTLYGAFLGVAIPGAFGAEGSEAYGVGLLAGAPAGFMAARAFTGNRSLSQGQARAITLGGTWGAWQGFGWREVFDIGIQETCETVRGDRVCFDDGDASEATFAAMIVGGLAGVATGAVLAREPIPAGVATAVNFGALWGTWFGVASGVLIDFEDDALLTATLAGGDIGLVTTALLAPGWNISRNRARLVSIAGVIGGLAGGGIDLLLQPDDEKVAIAIPLGTSIAGLVLGARATRDYDSNGMAASGDSGAGALVAVNGGRWDFGAPSPYPVIAVRETRRGTERHVALGLKLLDVRW